MTELKMFRSSIYHTISETYENLDKDINEYVKEKDLYIKSIHYDRLNDVIIANILFSDIPSEMFVL